MLTGERVVCVSCVFTILYAVVFPCLAVCHNCSCSWKTLPNRCIPQILQDFFVSEISKSLSCEKQNNIVILEEKHYIVGIANMTLTKLRV